MNTTFKQHALSRGISTLDYILCQLDALKAKTRAKPYEGRRINGLHAEEILFSYVERAIDKYFYRFNLVGVSNFLGGSRTSEPVNGK